MARLSLAIADAHSLKEKRMVLRRIKDRVKERIGVTVAEVGEHDVWQRAELGCAIASGDRGKALELIDAVVRVAMSVGGANITAIAKDVTTFDAERHPNLATAQIDDRTGSGDKAVGSDEWIPDEWREEAES